MLKILQEALVELKLGVNSLEECIQRILRRKGNHNYDLVALNGLVEEHLGKCIDLAQLNPSSEALHALPLEVVHEQCVLPFAVSPTELSVACVDPSAFELKLDLQIMSGKQIKFFRAEHAELKLALRKHYRNLQTPNKSETQVQLTPSKPLNSDKSPAIKLVEDAFREAYRTKSSDIHFEPSEQGLVVRLRQDGDLRVYRVVPARFREEVISRVKIMAQLDIAEKRRPQDGRIQWLGPAGKVDIRVSSLPTNHGEKIVLRLLDQSSVPLDLNILGMTEEQLFIFENYIRNPHGMILFTGPTGSGKTTSLYATLSSIRRPELNISTVEDPIEYRLEGINQTQVHSKIGLDFAQALRTLLRQDPNVILVGEIRDNETADLAVRAALTGHLVFSTLHTNDAPGALARLLDLGVESFLVSSSVSLVVAQRLVRKCCPDCLEWRPVEAHIAREFALDPQEHLPHPMGCHQCDGTGFQGRIALYEMMEMNDAIQEQLRHSADSNLIKAIALENGMQTLRMDGLEKARLGLTTLAEVAKETL